MRTLAFLLLTAAFGFVVLIGAAMSAYPGGNFFDPKRPGHHFWFNFLCDLLRAEGLDGRPNKKGAKLALFGMLMLVVAIVSYFVIAPARMALFPRAAVAVSFLGPLASLGLVGVALLPSDKFARLHTVALTTAALPGLVACALAIAAVVFDAQAHPGLRALGVALWLSLLGTFAIYARHTWFGGGFLRALPALQRVAIVLAIAWLCATAQQILLATGS